MGAPSEQPPLASSPHQPLCIDTCLQVQGHPRNQLVSGQIGQTHGARMGTLSSFPEPGLWGRPLPFSALSTLGNLMDLRGTFPFPQRKT